MMQWLMVRNKHGYLNLCIVQYAREGSTKQDERCQTIICSRASPLCKDFSGLFPVHNSFWQLHRQAIHLLWHVIGFCGVLFAGSFHSYRTHTSSRGESVLLSRHTRASWRSDPQGKPWNIKKGWESHSAAWNQNKSFLIGHTDETMVNSWKVSSYPILENCWIVTIFSPKKTFELILHRCHKNISTCILFLRGD